MNDSKTIKKEKETKIQRFRDVLAKIWSWLRSKFRKPSNPPKAASDPKDISDLPVDPKEEPDDPKTVRS
jgi:hypothetical protein